MEAFDFDPIPFDFGLVYGTIGSESDAFPYCGAWQAAFATTSPSTLLIPKYLYLLQAISGNYSQILCLKSALAKGTISVINPDGQTRLHAAWPSGSVLGPDSISP